MSDQGSITTWQSISDGWNDFCNANYYNPAAHDERAELQARLDFARKAEAAIQAMFPDNLAELTLRFAQFSSVDLASVLTTAACCEPREFDEYVLGEYREVQTDDSPDILDFGRFVRDFRQVVDPIWETVNKFPAEFFAIYHETHVELMDHVFAVIVDLLGQHLRHSATERPE